VKHRNDCILVLMDLIGIKKRALEGDAKASAVMRSFHELVEEEMITELSALDHAYVWNDSVLLLAYVNEESQRYQDAMRAADALKRKVDSISRSYAIAVKGRAFRTKTTDRNQRVTVIRASSYAMANCFEIEAQARAKKLRNAWYVDVRIAREVPETKATTWISVIMLPGGKRRRVYVHNGYLWKADGDPPR
jgi:hypothetical protein